ncbi:hypothetical protein CDAR_460131 [Caerostris darwini]|uniref:Uncharacterized protein n=1 Tax=Caerostris darwini TaxID=1538125 RepID=A0AAV4RC97_9ARAC|nr:hypothetical protein CDAR_460131 [Caerostris darwini]
METSNSDAGSELFIEAPQNISYINHITNSHEIVPTHTNRLPHPSPTPKNRNQKENHSESKTISWVTHHHREKQDGVTCHPPDRAKGSSHTFAFYFVTRLTVQKQCMGAIEDLVCELYPNEPKFRLHI